MPEDVGLYDIQTEMPALSQPSSRGLEALANIGPAGVDAILEEVPPSLLSPALPRCTHRPPPLRPDEFCELAPTVVAAQHCCSELGGH